MTGQYFDAVRRIELDELRTAIREALPENAVLRLDEDYAPALDVHAWWLTGIEDGRKAVNSLSFRLSSSMVAAYLRSPPPDRAEICSRLTGWAAWALDGGPRVNDGDEGFDISVVVPLSVFWPKRSNDDGPAS